MPSCSVYGCTSTSGDRTNVGLYSFPNRSRSPNRFKIWHECTRREDFVPGPNARICSRHFQESDLNDSDLLQQKLMPNSRLRSPRLKPGTFPTLFLGVNNTNTYSLRKSDRETKTAQDDAYDKMKVRKKIVEDLLLNSARIPDLSFSSSRPTEVARSRLHSCDEHTPVTNIANASGGIEAGIQVELGCEMIRKCSSFKPKVGSTFSFN